MFAAEVPGICRNLDRVTKNVRDYLGILCVVANRHKPYAFDKQYFRSMAATGGIFLYLFFCFLYEVRGLANINIFGLAIYYDVRSKRCRNCSKCLFVGTERLYQAIVANLQGLGAASGAAENGAQRRNELVRIRTYFQNLFLEAAGHALKPGYYAGINFVNPFNAVSPHKYSVVLQENHLRLVSPLGLIGCYAVIYFLE